MTWHLLGDKPLPEPMLNTMYDATNTQHYNGTCCRCKNRFWILFSIFWTEIQGLLKSRSFFSQIHMLSFKSICWVSWTPLIWKKWGPVLVALKFDRREKQIPDESVKHLFNMNNPRKTDDILLEFWMRGTGILLYYSCDVMRRGSSNNEKARIRGQHTYFSGVGIVLGMFKHIVLFQCHKIILKASVIVNPHQKTTECG